MHFSEATVVAFLACGGLASAYSYDLYERSAYAYPEAEARVDWKALEKPAGSVAGAVFNQAPNYINAITNAYKADHQPKQRREAYPEFEDEIYAREAEAEFDDELWAREAEAKFDWKALGKPAGAVLNQGPNYINAISGAVQAGRQQKREAYPEFEDEIYAREARVDWKALEKPAGSVAGAVFNQAPNYINAITGAVQAGRQHKREAYPEFEDEIYAREAFFDSEDDIYARDAMPEPEAIAEALAEAFPEADPSM